MNYMVMMMIGQSGIPKFKERKNSRTKTTNNHRVTTLNLCDAKHSRRIRIKTVTTAERCARSEREKKKWETKVRNKSEKEKQPKKKTIKMNDESKAK